MDSLNLNKKEESTLLKNANITGFVPEQTEQKISVAEGLTKESEHKTSVEKYSKIIDNLLAQRKTMFEEPENINKETADKNALKEKKEETEAITLHQEKIDMVRRYAINVASAFLEKWAAKIEKKKDGEPIKPITIKIKGADGLANATAIAAMTVRGWMLEKYGKSNPSLCMKLIDAVHFNLVARDPVAEEGIANGEVNFDQETIKDAKVSKIDKSLKYNKDLPIASLGANVSSTVFYTLKANDKNVQSAKFLNTNKVFISETPISTELMSELEKKYGDGIYYVNDKHEVKSYDSNMTDWTNFVRGKIDELRKTDDAKAELIKEVVNTKIQAPNGQDKSQSKSQIKKETILKKEDDKNKTSQKKDDKISNANTTLNTDIEFSLNDIDKDEEKEKESENKDKKKDIGINEIINKDKIDSEKIQIKITNTKKEDEQEEQKIVDEYTVTESNCEELLDKYKDYEYKGLKVVGDKIIGEPKNILLSSDPKEIQKYIDDNKRSWLKDGKEALLAHYVFRTAALTKLHKTIKAVRDKAIVTPLVDYLDEKNKGTLKKHNGMRLSCVQKRPQTTTLGCWSQSMSTLLGAFGIDVSQEEIRSYRPDISVDDKDADALIYNLNTNQLYSVIEQSKLISLLMPKMVVHNIEIEKKDEEYIKDSSRNIIEKRKYEDALKDQLLYALETCHSPISIMYGRHFRTVYGYKTENGKMILLCKNSNNPIPNAEEEVSLDELLSKGNLSLTFLQEDTSFNDNANKRLKMLGNLGKEKGENKYHKGQKQYTGVKFYNKHLMQYTAYSNSEHKVEKSLNSDRERIEEYPREMTEYITEIFKVRIDGLEEDKDKLDGVVSDLSELTKQLKAKKPSAETIKKVVNNLKSKMEAYCKNKDERADDKTFRKKYLEDAKQVFGCLEEPAKKDAINRADDTATKMISAYSYMTGDGLISLLVEILSSKYSG